MAIQITINGSSYPILFQSFNATLQAGLAGTTLSAQVCSIGGSPPNPAAHQKVELTIGSLSFDCRLADINHENRSGGSVVVYSLTGNGAQERLRRNVSYDTRVTTSASEILEGLLSGSGITGSVPDDKNLTSGFSYSGSLADAVQTLATRAKMGIYLGPDGVLYLRDLDNLPTADFPWEVGSGNPFSELKKSQSQELPITRVIVNGAVVKEHPDDPDSESATAKYTADGINNFVELPILDEITDVRLNSVSQTVTFRGSGSESAAECVHYRGRRRLIFNTLPTEGDEIEVDYTVQFARGQADDTATQALLNSQWPGWDGIVEHEIKNDSIRTSSQAQQEAESLIELLSQPKKSHSATVHSPLIFEPLYLVPAGHTVDGWDETLPIVSNQLTWDSARGELRQQVTCQNGLAAVNGPSSGLAGVLGAGIRATRPQPAKPLPTESSTAGSPDFSISVTPIDNTVTEGSNTGATFLITVTPSGGFANDLDLSATGLPGCTFDFSPATVGVGSWTSALTVTPTDDDWTDGDSDEEGSFNVSGTDGYITRSGGSEVVIDEDPGCESTGYAYAIEDYDCSALPEYCCSWPDDEELAILVPWSVIFYDNCDQVFGEPVSGTLRAWSHDPGNCAVTLADNSYLDPNGVEHFIDCGCIVP